VCPPAEVILQAIRPMQKRESLAFWSAFDFDLETLELRKHGTRLRMEQKPAQLLRRLLERPGEVVGRDELANLLWPGEQHGDFDQRLNKAIHKLRSILGDDPANPRYVQTLSGTGYRFIADVSIVNGNGASYSGTNEIEVRLVTPQSNDDGDRTADAEQYPGNFQIRGEEFAQGPSRQIVTTGNSEPITSNSRVLARRFGVVWLPLSLCLLAPGLWFLKTAIDRNHAPIIHSVAVLPLRNLSPDPGQDYFADGVTEDLITNLAQSLPLRVISRTSVMQYKESKEPIRQIARDLGVDTIVEGAVARSGRRVTITVQLIDATQDKHLWARKYDRQAKDLLDIESEVSREIANQIGGTLATQRIGRGSEIRAVDPETYELCLLGRFHWNKRTAADLDKSADYYRQAIARDPNYAPAYAGLANAYALMPSYDSVAMQETYAKGAAASRRAIDLDQNLPEPYAILGLIDLNDGNWRRAGTELQHALELNPNLATAHQWLAYYLLFSGQINDAIAEMESARRLDPLSLIINADEGQVLYVAKRYDDARTRLRQAIELAPNNGQAYETLALTDLETGDPTDAIKEAQAGLAFSSTSPRTLGEAGYVLAETGHAAEARGLLRTLNGMALRGSGRPIYLAMIYVGLNEPQQALEQLQLQVETFGGLEGASQWHAFDELRHDPRYQELITAGNVVSLKPDSRTASPGSVH
jgi:TolB-like protein/DNA-binding winged helix-turn-helix (wHTH) protein/Tfp pilus assembly protein PilF